MLIRPSPAIPRRPRRLPRRSAAGHTAAEPVKAPSCTPRAAGGGATTCRRSSRSTHSSGNARRAGPSRRRPGHALGAVGAPPFGIDRAIVTSTARYHEASERTLRASTVISSAALTHRQPEKIPGVAQGATRDLCSRRRGSAAVARGDVLRVRAAAGIDWRTRIGEMVSLGHSLAGRVAETRAPVPLPTRQRPAGYAESIRRSGLRALRRTRC